MLAISGAVLAGLWVANLRLGAEQSTPPPSVVERSLEGFRYLRVHPPTYDDGQIDPHGLAGYALKQLSQQGWVAVSESQVTDRDVLSALADCGLGHTANNSLSNSVSFICHDALGRVLFTLQESGTGMTLKGDLESAIRKIAQRLRVMRPRFDANKTVDIIKTLPAVERTDVNEEEIDQRIASGQLASPIEGVWTNTESYRLAIFETSRQGEFTAVVLESLRQSLPIWEPGMIKARISIAADGRTFAMRWKDNLRREVNGVGSLQNDGKLVVTLSLQSRQEVTTFIKLRPAARNSPLPPDTASRAAGERSVISTGTAFFVANSYVATNHHVIKDGTSFDFVVPGDQVIDLELAVADAVNDLAILRVSSTVKTSLSGLPLGSAIRLGGEALVVGFPLGSVLGDGHKVTTGVVSSIDGIAGDPRMFQFTAPIQPGSSGSPVLDMSGNVIGIVTATLDPVEAAKRSGSLPQNVNFAVKADYLALLLKRVSALPSQLGTKREAAPDIVDRARAFIGQVRTYR